MAQEKVNLSKVNYNTSQFEKVVDIYFSKATPPPPPTSETITNIPDFFKAYETLFYQIPQTGDTNSHEYLIKKSTEYVGEQQTLNQTQALIAEITALKLENVESFKKEAELLTLQTENALLKSQLQALSSSPS